MIRPLLTALGVTLALTNPLSGAPEDRPFRKNVRTANRAVVAIVDTRTDEVLTNGTTVGSTTVLTKASEIEDIPNEYLRVRTGDLLPVTTTWIDGKNDLAVLTVDGLLPDPVDFSSVGDLPQGRILTTVTGGTTNPQVGTVSVPAREIELRNGVLGVKLVIFPGRRYHPVVIEEIFPGGGAEAAGLLAGDTILAIDGSGVGNARQLIETVFSHLPGEIVKLSILRDTDQKFEKNVKLAHMTVLDPVSEIRARNIRISGPISKRVSGFTRAIQHDIALSPQEMGTPLLDTSGRVVAINIARADRLTTYALPAAIARTAIDAASASLPATPEETAAPAAE